MKAIILAGGEGARLRPLTENTPKPLLKVGGVPCIVRLLGALRQAGVREAAVTTCYLADRLKGALGKECEGVFLHYPAEPAPLGTAGSVRAAAEFLNEPFFVLPGDAVFDFPLAPAAQAHRESGASATLLLTRHPVPSEYGTVLLDEKGRVTRFLEKPSALQTFTDLINTGIYLFSPSILPLFPEKVPLDFGKDVFPSLLARGIALQGREEAGYWCDIGSPEAYLACNLRYSDREDGSLLGENVKVGKNVTISGSYLLDGVQIGNNTEIKASIVGKDGKIGKNAVLGEGCVLGDGCLIGDGAILGRGTRLRGGTVVGAGEILHEAWQAAGFEEVSGEGLTAPSFPPRLCRRIGEAFAAAVGGKGLIGVLSGGEDCDAEASALLDGVRSGGCDGIRLGYGFEAMALPVCAAGDLAGLLFCDASDSGRRVLLYDRFGLYPTRAVERRFLAALHGTEASSPSPGSEAAPENALMTRYLPRALPPFLRLDGMKIALAGLESAPACSPTEVCARLLRERGAVVADSASLTLTLPRGGKSGTLRCGADEIDLLHADALLLRMRPEWFPSPLPLPASYPACFSSLTQVIRYSACPTSPESEGGRDLAFSSSSLLDACRAFPYFLCLMREESLTLRGLLTLLPPFVLTESHLDVPPSSRLRLLSSLGTPSLDCVLRVGPSATARISPDPRGYRLLCEAESMEAAAEILGEVAKEVERGASGGPLS